MKHTRSAAALAFVLLMTGCAAGAPGEVTDEIDTDAALRVGVTTIPVNLDPDQARTYAGAAFYLDPVYDRLLKTNAQGELEPMLATSWEFIDDGATLRLELRDDVTFSDDTPFNAEVAKANLDRSLSEVAGVPIRTTLNSVASVEVADEFTLDIHVKPGAGADVPMMLADPGGYMISGAALANPDLDQMPVGSGPYVVTEFVPNVAASYERRDVEYWGGEDQANFATIRVEGVVDPRTLLDSMVSGQYDLILVDKDERTDRLADQGYVVLNPTIGYLGVMFNKNRVPEFEDARVRQAFSYAIDRKAISEVTLGGACFPTQQMIAPGDIGHVPALDDEYPFDPDRARELFEEAGIESLDLTALYIASSPTAEVAEAVQAMLGDVGVSVTLKATTAPTQTADWLENTADMRMSSQTSMADKGRLLLRSTNDPILLGLQSDVVSKASKGLIDSSLPEDERRDIVMATNTAMVDDVFNIVICHRTGAAVGATNLVGLDEVGSLVRAGFDYRPLGLTK